MAFFSININASKDNKPRIAGLIAGTGEVRDSESTHTAIEMLRALREEINFCEAYIIRSAASAR